MNSIELLQQSRDEFSALTSDNNDFNRAWRRLEMIVEKSFDKKSRYLEKLSSISFHCPVYFGESDDNNLWFISGRNEAINLIDVMIEDLQLDIQKPSTQVIDMNKNTKIFIVHGHDNLAKVEVARFLEKLGLEAIILHEQTSSGQTIIEKLESNTDVGFAVVLYTACDVGKHKDGDILQKRARQNVVFEHGYLIGKIGRKNVLALVKDDVEKPSDIAGVVYEVMDNNGAWQYKLAKELKSSSFDVDMNRI